MSTENKHRTQEEDFEELTKHVLAYLNAHHHPHTLLVATPTNVQVLEGVVSSGEVFDYVRD